MFATNIPDIGFQDVHHKKVITTFLIVVVLVCSLFACLFVNDSTGASLVNALYVKNEDELKNAIQASTKETIIALDKDITLTNTITIPTNKDISLTSNKATGFYKLIGGLTVENGGVLKIDGINVNSPWCGVIVDWGGTFYLYSGIISGNTASSRGVSNDGTFMMSGGIISGNTNSGVYNSGVFKMSGGEISGNTATDSGGGIYNAYRGTIEISGGKISGNTANYGGGVHIVYGEFKMSGGEIMDNTAYKSGGGIYNAGGLIYDQNNIEVRSSFVMSGGKIAGNTATDDGGGIYNNGNLTISSGTITHNTANTGGGIYNNLIFNKYGGTISENTAKNGDNNIPHLTTIITNQLTVMTTHLTETTMDHLTKIMKQTTTMNSLLAVLVYGIF